MRERLFVQPGARARFGMKGSNRVTRAPLRPDREPVASLPIDVMHHGAVGLGLFLGAVEGRPMRADAHVLHYGGHPFAPGQFVLQGAHVPEQHLALGGSRRSGKMAAHALLQPDAHADVHRLSGRVEKPVHARLVRESVKLCGRDVLGHPVFPRAALQRVRDGRFATLRRRDAVEQLDGRFDVAHGPVPVDVPDL